MNLVVLQGNLGKDPLTKTVGDNLVSEFSVATKEYKDGTAWHNVKVWGKAAEICDKYLRKGSPVLLQGRISYRKYTDKQGVEKYVTEIVADKIELIGAAKKDDPQAKLDDFDAPF